MDKKTGIIIGALIAFFVALIGISLTQRNSYDYNQYDLTRVNAADEASGNFPEMVNGDPEKAKVFLVEYGNYQCTACAPLNPKINELIESYNGEVALIFRSMSLPQHDNGTASAAAALAAARQGYWKEYKDILYSNQDDWYYSTGNTRQAKFEQYFLTVSDNQGDLEQFREDMASKETKQKITFDEKLANRAGAEWSPYFTLDGELISQQGITSDEFINLLREKLDEKLGK